MEPCLLVLQASGLISADLIPQNVEPVVSITAHHPHHHLYEATYQRYLDAFKAHAYAHAQGWNEGPRNLHAKALSTALSRKAEAGGQGLQADRNSTVRPQLEDGAPDPLSDGPSGSLLPSPLSAEDGVGAAGERHGASPLRSVQQEGLARERETSRGRRGTNKSSANALRSGSISMESDSPTVTHAEEVACWAAQIKLALTLLNSAETEAARLAFLMQTRTLLVKQLLLPWKSFVADVLVREAEGNGLKTSVSRSSVYGSRPAST